jgi:DNA helicase II / ATP-dependent DNA helicase PcrA
MRRTPTMVNAANRIARTDLDPALLAAEAEASGKSFLEYWALAAKTSGNAIGSRLADMALRIVQSRAVWRGVVTKALGWLPETAGEANGIVTDAAEDKAAWETTVREMRERKRWRR